MARGPAAGAAGRLFRRHALVSFQFGQALPQVHQRSPGIPDLTQSSTGNSKITFCPATALGSGFPQFGSNQAALLQTLQRGIDTCDDHLATGLFFKFLGYGHPIRILAQTHQRQQQHQVKVSKVFALSHLFTILKK